MRSFSRFLSGFIWGGMVGAGLVLLLTPTTGENLRAQFIERKERMESEVRRAAADRRAELERQLAELREPRQPGGY